jgi:hypothetical protein
MPEMTTLSSIPAPKLQPLGVDLAPVTPPAILPAPTPDAPVPARRILSAIVTDISKSGFVITFLAIVALVISIWSLRVAIEQQASPPAIPPAPYQGDAPAWPHVVKPAHPMFDLPQVDAEPGLFDGRCAA